MLDRARLGLLHGVGLLKAVAALVQGLLVQVVVPVDGLDCAGGADDKVFVGLKLDQWVLSRQCEGEGEKKEEKGLHGCAQCLRMAEASRPSVSFKGGTGNVHRVQMDSNNDNWSLHTISVCVLEYYCRLPSKNMNFDILMFGSQLNM